MNMDATVADDVRTVDRMLNLWLPKESARPVTIHRAMRYSIFAGGKRMRPVLCMAAARACGIRRPADALPGACAVECVHTYSLIHDDLPCMDDDDMRRGRPTAHRVFGEGIAVLSGDALLALAFEILARMKPTARYSVADYIAELARAAGSRALVGGQVADLEGEKKKCTPADLRFIHRGKTAAMVIASLKLGAMAADATPRTLAILEAFGDSLGLAFQVVDDILDITRTSEQLGKSAGKDVAAGKTTYPALLGLEASRKEAAKLTAKALSSLGPLGERATPLRNLAEKLLSRQA
jgi:geranylgeranyl diphosphate synthase type II